MMGMAGRASSGGGRGVAAGGRAGGRLGSLSRLTGAGAAAGRGAGRGVRGAPLQRRVPGAARAMLSSSSNGGGGNRGSASAGTASAAAGGGGGGESSKMKMIDISEIEGLNRMQADREKNVNMTSVQARKLERKRKLLEDAAASGLRNREKKVPRATNDNAGVGASGIDIDVDVAVGLAAGNEQLFSELNHDVAVAAAPAAPIFTQNDEGIDNGAFVEGQQYHPQQLQLPPEYHPQQLQLQQQYHPQQQEQQQQFASLDSSLLEKSNKLSNEDRHTIHAFFAHRAMSNNSNSTDPLHHLQPPPLALPMGGDVNTGIWKVKLNEEKDKVDANTGEIVKETLYLELDYRTLGYKKTRKIKRK